MTYQDLKRFCNSLTTEQLQQEVHLSQVDNSAIKVVSAHVTDEDIWFDHCDALGNLEQIKQDNPDDWEDVIEDAILCPKGTVMLVDE